MVSPNLGFAPLSRMGTTPPHPEEPKRVAGNGPEANIRTFGKVQGKKYKNVAKCFLRFKQMNAQKRHFVMPGGPFSFFFLLPPANGPGEKQKFCFIGIYA